MTFTISDGVGVSFASDSISSLELQSPNSDGLLAARTRALDSEMKLETLQKQYRSELDLAARSEAELCQELHRLNEAYSVLKMESSDKDEEIQQLEEQEQYVQELMLQLEAKEQRINDMMLTIDRLQRHANSVRPNKPEPPSLVCTDEEASSANENSDLAGATQLSSQAARAAAAAAAAAAAQISEDGLLWQIKRLTEDVVAEAEAVERLEHEVCVSPMLRQGLRG